jgi:hypothetical protein
VSAHEELEASARAAGKAGKSYTDWSFSDEVSEAVGALDRKDRRVDTARFEAAFCEGRREYREGGGWKSVWTTAPADYDGFGTETAEGPFEWEGRHLRRVLVDPEFYGWQTGRYPVCWDEDPREVEARIQAKIAAEKAERDAREQRRAEGLVWIRTAVVDGDDDTRDEEARAHGLGWEDVRAERRRRADEKVAAERAAKWAVCRAAFKDGDTLIDNGVEGYRGTFGWVSGQEPRAWIRCRVKPHYTCEDDASEAVVVSNEDLQRSVGTLELVAARIASGRMRIAGPEDVVPPRAVVDRIGCRFDEIARVEAFGKVAWVGRPFGSAGGIVVDDAGHLVRAKNLREAAESIHRLRYFGRLSTRSFKLFECEHERSRVVRFARDGVDPSALKVVSVCTSCGACRVSGERKWHDSGCLELNLNGEWRESDRFELLADGAPS